VRSSGSGKVGKTDVSFEAVAGGMASGSVSGKVGLDGVSAEVEGEERTHGGCVKHN
jgi:hypothetical protein